MIEIKRAEEKTDFLAIEQLAETIWREHYLAMIGNDQVEYMLENFQSVLAMESQLNQGYKYYMVVLDEQLVGYFSFLEDENALLLSKYYILQEKRGQGLGRSSMNFIMAKARSAHLPLIRLTVNKNNSDTIEIYKRLGFQEVGQVVMDIGNGYVMDDYVLQMEV